MSWVAGVEGDESPKELGKRAEGRDAVDWTKMGSSVISLAETVTRSTSRRFSFVFDPDASAGMPLDESCYSSSPIDSAESLDDNTLASITAAISAEDAAVPEEEGLESLQPEVKQQLALAGAGQGPLLLCQSTEDKRTSFTVTAYSKAERTERAALRPCLYNIDNHDKLLAARMAGRSRHAALPKEPKLCSALIDAI
ncbi:hypothetical protein T484DRAFT_1747764 [Baffinella frigidus]|nr:hypothetical protein T484DRAFT_1747764 [Cryptophyta sp. CCMP2293]